MNAYVIILVCLIVGGVLGAFVGYELSETRNKYRWQLKGYLEGWEDAEKLYGKHLDRVRDILKEMCNEQWQREQRK